MTDFSYDALREEVLQDREARTAAKENAMRRFVAASIDAARTERRWSLRDLAREMGTSVSQVQRLLNREHGGSVTLRTLVRAADVLERCVTINLRPVAKADGALLSFGGTWHRVDDLTVKATRSTMRKPPRQMGRSQWTKLVDGPAEDMLRAVRF